MLVLWREGTGDFWETGRSCHRCATPRIDVMATRRVLHSLLVGQLAQDRFEQALRFGVIRLVRGQDQELLPRVFVPTAILQQQGELVAPGRLPRLALQGRLVGRRRVVITSIRGVAQR